MLWVRWLFTRWFAGLSSLAAFVGNVLAARQWDTVEANLRGALSWSGVVGFAGALIVSKLLHEVVMHWAPLAFGVRVGDMGVALLVM